MSTMRCAIYSRYSSDLQKDTSIDDQIMSCTRFADGRGWTVVEEHVYQDRAISGASTSGRRGLQALMESADSLPRPFDYVLIDDTSRLSRDMGESNRIIEILKWHGVYVCFVAQGIDTKDEQSHLTVGVNSIIDSQYRRDLAKKTLPRSVRRCRSWL